MDDETQYRCAGLIQAEIEQFIDDLGGREPKSHEKGETTEEESSQAGSDTEKEDNAKEDGDGAMKKAKGKRGRRKGHREDTPGKSVISLHYL